VIFKKQEKIIYFALFDKVLGIGIEKKINGFVQSARYNGWDISKRFYHKKGILEHIKLGYDILNCKEKNVILRSTAHSMILIYPFCVLAAFSKNLFLEVPTPHITSLSELLRFKDLNFKNYFKSFLLVILGPLTYLPFIKIIQYSNEGKWWTLFVKNRTYLATNGIDIECVPIRDFEPDITDELCLIGVANLSFWHGYDRVIRAIDFLINVKKVNFKIKFLIVGDGDELLNLKKMVSHFQLNKNIIFIPITDTKGLNSYYSQSHLAVGSIGLHRKSLKLASELKAREYSAFGIPFIASGSDLDFLNCTNFRFEVPLDDSVNSLVNLIENVYFGKILLPSKYIIRNYAENYLNMDIKVKNILSL
jgi:glycosyltransferase involved in cell wall biosynthesis